MSANFDGEVSSSCSSSQVSINFSKPADSPEGLIHHILIFMFAGSLISTKKGTPGQWISSISGDQQAH